MLLYIVLRAKERFSDYNLSSSFRDKDAIVYWRVEYIINYNTL